jgi:hypothetical protein
MDERWQPHGERTHRKHGCVALHTALRDQQLGPPHIGERLRGKRRYGEGLVGEQPPGAGVVTVQLCSTCEAEAHQVRLVRLSL